MTVRENMAFALKLAKTPPQVIDQKVTEAARVLDLTQHLNRKPANLSGGQRQRVAMGRAIVRDPAAFLMDEPLSNLDAKLRVQMRTEVSRIQKRLGTTTVYVTHDQVEAMTLGDRVALMRTGLLQQVGSPQELYECPVADAPGREERARASGRHEAGASGDTIGARLDVATRLREGPDAELWLNTAAVHLFDPSSGKNLGLADGGGGAASAAPAAPAGAAATARATPPDSGPATGNTGDTGPAGPVSGTG